MRVLIAAVSSATGPDGVSRHAINLARCLLLCRRFRHVDLIVGSWQQQYVRSLLGESNDRLTLHAVAEVHLA